MHNCINTVYKSDGTLNIEVVDWKTFLRGRKQISRYQSYKLRILYFLIGMLPNSTHF